MAVYFSTCNIYQYVKNVYPYTSNYLPDKILLIKNTSFLSLYKTDCNGSLEFLMGNPFILITLVPSMEPIDLATSGNNRK